MNPNAPIVDKRQSKKTMAIVFLTIFLDLVGFGIIIPIQPFYAKSFGAEPALITLLGASYSLMQFLFSPIWGRLSDRVGRRPIMLVSIAITSLGYCILGFADSIALLFVARMLSGLGGANIGTAQAIIADSTTPELRAKGMGLVGAAFGLGFIFGPIMGGYFVRFGLATPIFIAAGLCAVNLVLAFIILPETRFLRAEKKTVAHLGFSWKTLKHASRHPGVARLFALYFYFSIAFSMMEQVLALFIEKTWVAGGTGTPELLAQRAAQMTTHILVVVGVTATLVQGGLIGRLVKRFGERQLVILGIACVSASLLSIPLTGAFDSYYWLAGLMIPLAFGAGVFNPSISSLLSRSVDADEQGGSLGLGQSLSALGRVVGPGFSGALFQINKGAPFWVGGALMGLCVLVAFTVRGSHRSHPTPVSAV